MFNRSIEGPSSPAHPSACLPACPPVRNPKAKPSRASFNPPQPLSPTHAYCTHKHTQTQANMAVVPQHLLRFVDGSHVFADAADNGLSLWLLSKVCMRCSIESTGLYPYRTSETQNNPFLHVFTSLSSHSPTARARRPCTTPGRWCRASCGSTPSRASRRGPSG